MTITVTGISKGAGMIRPNMATMLGYIATDAKVSRDVLQSLMLDGANKSFNRITIDGDTSTNDCCMLIATGQANLPEITSRQRPAVRRVEAGGVRSVHGRGPGHRA